MAFGPCICCARPFGFNPSKVPSIRINGVREPICKGCVDQANPLRAAHGLPPIEVHPDAYEPQSEEDMTD